MITSCVPCMKPSVSLNKPVCTKREIDKNQSIKKKKSQALSVKVLFSRKGGFSLINIAKENFRWISQSVRWQSFV